MKRRFVPAWLLAISFWFAPGVAHAEENWHAQAFTYGDRGIHMTQYWSSGRKFRAETVIAGHRVVSLVVGPTYYVLDPVGGRGIAIARSPKAMAAESKGGRPFGIEGRRIQEQGGEKVGEERVGGVTCDLWRVTDSRGRREVWVTQTETKLPVRVQLFDRASGATHKTDYVDWLRDISFPPFYFEPDPRLTLRTYTYDEWISGTGKEDRDRLPVLFGELLHGETPS